MLFRPRARRSPLTLVVQSALLVLASIVPVLLLLAGLNYQYASTMLQKGTGDDLRNGSLRMEAQLSSVLLRELERLRTLTLAADLRAARTLRPAPFDPAAHQRAYEQAGPADPVRKSYVNNPAGAVLKSFREAFPNRALVILADTTGGLESVTSPLWPYWNLSTQPWWPDLQGQGAEAVSITPPMPVPGFENLLFLAMPLLDDNNQPIGVVVVGLRFNNIVAPILARPDSADTTVMLVTTSAGILYTTQTGTPTALPAGWRSGLGALDANTAVLDADVVAYAPLQVAEGYPLDDARHLHALNQLGWTVLQEVPTSTAFAVLQEQRNLLAASSLGAGVLLLILIMGTLRFSVRRLVVQPLAALEAIILNVRTHGLTTTTLDDARTHLPASINEVGRLGQLFGQMLEDLTNLTQEREQTYQRQQSVVVSLRTTAAQLSGAAAEQEIITQQTSTVQGQVLAAFRAFDSAAAAIADRAHEVANQAILLKDQHAAGDDAVATTQAVLAALQNTVEDFAQGALILVTDAEAAGSLITEVQQVAESTHLLSLNALIEAAGAGDNGRRFSVVAQEVRGLADMAASTAESIEQALDRMVNQSQSTATGAQQARHIVDQGARQMSVLIELMQMLYRSADALAAQADEIRRFSAEQRTQSHEIGLSSSRLAEAMQQVLGASQQIATQAQALLAVASSLDRPHTFLVHQ